MAIQKHTHKLKRHKYHNGENIYFCVLECSYKINVKLSLGKTTQCWRCGKSFILNEAAIRLARPHCNDCTEKKEEILSIPTIVAPPSALKDRLQKIGKRDIPVTADLEEDVF